MNHYRVVLLILLQVCLSGNSYGQHYTKPNRERISLDSIYLLDISVYQKLNVLERYNDSTSTPYLSIDFPFSNYHPETKTLSIIREKFSVPKTIIAIIRVERWMDPSFGSGGSGYLIPIDKKDRTKSFVVDSIITIDSVSSSGIFYLTINKKSKLLGKNVRLVYDDHQQMQNTELSYDIIKEYSIRNYGYIKRRFKYKK